MSGYFNYNKPAVQILRDLIYATNGFMLPATGVLYDAPIPITPLVADRYQRDTVIKVQMDPTIPYQPWYGHCTFLYSRVQLGEFVPVQNPVVPIVIPAYPFSIWDILPLINAYYGLQLTTADVLDTTYTVAAYPITVYADPSSPTFSGSMILNVQGVVAPPAPTPAPAPTPTPSPTPTPTPTPAPPSGDPYNIDGETGVYF